MTKLKDSSVQGDFGKRPRISRAVIVDDEPKRRGRREMFLAIIVVSVLAVIAAWLVLG